MYLSTYNNCATSYQVWPKTFKHIMRQISDVDFFSHPMKQEKSKLHIMIRISLVLKIICGKKDIIQINGNMAGIYAPGWDL